MEKMEYFVPAAMPAANGQRFGANRDACLLRLCQLHALPHFLVDGIREYTDSANAKVVVIKGHGVILTNMSGAVHWHVVIGADRQVSSAIMRRLVDQAIAAFGTAAHPDRLAA